MLRAQLIPPSPPRAPKAPSVPCASPWLPAPGVQLRPRPLRPSRRDEATRGSGAAASREAVRSLPLAATRRFPVHGRADERSLFEVGHQSGRIHCGGIDNRAPFFFAPQPGDVDGEPSRGIQPASHVSPNAVSCRPVAGARDQGISVTSTVAVILFAQLQISASLLPVRFPLSRDGHFCRQPEALYSIDQSVQPPERMFQLVEKVNPSVFCLQTANYKAGLSFQAPEIPTLQNFDRLLREFDRGSSFATGKDLVLEAESETPREAGANDTSRYKFKDLIQTTDGFLRLPAPLLSRCAHNNPAGFLMTQAEKCNTAIEMDECTTLPQLSMLFYTNLSILAVPNSSQTVNLTIQSITIQTPEGLRTRLASADVVLLPALNNQSCSNVVLEASYLVNFTEAGEIVEAAVSLVLGTVPTSAIFLQQTFAIRFIQQATRPVPFSGSPGYLSLNEGSQLTMMKSTTTQDCFQAEGSRTPVLFGYNILSGCKVRITESAECTLLAPEILRVLKGQNFPDYVASFGDSLPQNRLDWVEISYNVTKPATCEIPVSFEVEVKWTKYGSLLNPQAKIESLTVIISTAALPKPGYKAWPTIEAHLPFDFFFPFV
ncbi:hypothetical protein E2320_012448 [Naja naja]|nr:hypothetical protein E2320_012448 [Naja naja]